MSGPHTVIAGYPLTDLALARRLERAEAAANAAFVDARARSDPGVGAEWLEVAGAYAMFDGPDSPLTQTFGLGLFDPVGESELERIERFFRQRGAPVFHEVCPLVHPDLLTLLRCRGYSPVEFSTVMLRPTSLELAAPDPGLVVRRIDDADVPTWSRTAADGWSSESQELAVLMEQLGAVLGRARGTHCFLAYRGTEPIAAAALSLVTDVALLAGASTSPQHRRLGAQRALLQARLRFAAESGAALAMMVAAPGSASQRNAERQGFRIAYTRSKFMLA